MLENGRGASPMPFVYKPPLPKSVNILEKEVDMEYPNFFTHHGFRCVKDEIQESVITKSRSNAEKKYSFSQVHQDMVLGITLTMRINQYSYIKYISFSYNEFECHKYEVFRTEEDT